MNTALILVDIQNDYFPGGRCELFATQQTAAVAARLLELFRYRSWPVLHVRHIAQEDGATFFLPGSRGSELAGAVAPLPSEEVIVKHQPNSFVDTKLGAKLSEMLVERVVIAGMMSHMCIDSTVRAAAEHGYEVLLVHDACTTKALAFGGTTVAASDVHVAFMASLGAFAKVVSFDELKALL